MTESIQHHFRFLGFKVRDRITGFVGIGASVCFDVYGCIQTCISPPMNKEGKLDHGQWFDNNRLELLDKKQAQPLHENIARLIPAEPPAVKRRDAAGGFDKPAR